jgi:farnesyl-diphosphate farnesyltransferase
VDWELLKRVSRSFYITLRLLPEQVRETIALAYLLARISDTEADGASSPAERELLSRKEELTKLLAKSPDKEAIEKVWTTIREGQEFDKERFKNDPAPLSATERDCYTYLVAGCVGEFWTRLCASKIPDYSEKPFEIMLDRGTRFGKGLQLVNILRDRAADAKIGRVYITEKELPSGLETARAHLGAAREYVKALRRGRLRVACALPLLIGQETLDLVEEYPEARRVKVSRLRVWVLLLRSLLY